ncbi:MAG: riboflavin synthase [Crocinitomicaceae bacterium]|nr:riboflavin synthase [Crocinitomicaceae bacterium]|tara:strand:- start:14229 stop:14819 length:591 start_codon:yes stop_codon:yes gene_type:complete
MFTGIVEAVGTIEKIETEGTNVHFTLSCPFNSELKIDQSLAHDGVCLTVVACSSSKYVVTAIEETMVKTSLDNWKVGDKVNLERCMMMGDRYDGHMVQGHVDTIGTVLTIEDKGGSHELTIEHHDSLEWMTVPKGSITVNGISLTVVQSDKGRFSIALIPYTWDETTMHLIKVGDKVNLEFDVIGKYISRILAARN